MARIELETKVKQSREVCFDLSRSIDLHMKSTSQTNEKAIGGVTSGLIDLNEEVLWEARHFGIRWKLRSRISEFDRPNHFQDIQVQGIFKYFIHDHHFVEDGDHTVMHEIFDFKCPFGLFGIIAEPIVYNHMRDFLIERNRVIKQVAESDEWVNFLDKN